MNRSPKKKSPICTAISSSTKKRCKKNIATTLGCQYFCHQHAKCYLKGYICKDYDECTYEDNRDYDLIEHLNEFEDINELSIRNSLRRKNYLEVLDTNINYYSSDIKHMDSEWASQSVANAFQSVLRHEMDVVFLAYPEIRIKVNELNVIYENSPFLGSSCLGFLLEVIVDQSFPDLWDLPPPRAPYDLKLKHADFDLFVNLKVEKVDESKETEPEILSHNMGIVSRNEIKNLYLSNDKPKLYLIVKISYSINVQEQFIRFRDVQYLFLDAILDDLDWRHVRLQNTIPLSRKRISDIPSYNSIIDIIKNK